ncbi:MAG: N-acetylmuramidase family protein [Prevotella sp.]|nr:N-acetylmuramidase family protein [Bacteroides sp.]MCM1366768.1 N-acetylmuramidase family protein [Prevotella sp.]MCM1437387.1 N-acetylmuramidase family protein [Prevotella sp.]
MMTSRLKAATVIVILLVGIFSGKTFSQSPAAESTKPAPNYLMQAPRDSLLAGEEKTRYTELTDADFELVSKEIGVEVAAMKAVVSIEAGSAMKGFWAPGIPVINFDRTMYNKYRNSSPKKGGAKGEKVPDGLSGYGLRQWTQLINARKVNAQGANMGTFWGMFQIGGFNYKLCGCSSVDEFVKLMSMSELEQLQLFATFLVNTGMVKDLKAKNWASFSRKYNGPSYARRGYHTKMAAAYARFSKK